MASVHPMDAPDFGRPVPKASLKEKLLIGLTVIIVLVTMVMDLILFTLTIIQFRGDGDGGDQEVMAGKVDLPEWQRPIPANYEIGNVERDGWWEVENTLCRMCLFAYGAPIFMVFVALFGKGGGDHRAIMLDASVILVLSFIAMCFDAYDLEEEREWCSDVQEAPGNSCDQGEFVATTVLSSMVFLFCIAAMTLVYYSIKMAVDCGECGARVLWPRRRSDMTTLCWVSFAFLAVVMGLATVQIPEDEWLVPLNAQWEDLEYKGGWPHANAYGRTILTVAVFSTLICVLLYLRYYRGGHGRVLHMLALATLLECGLCMFLCVADVQEVFDYEDECDAHNDYDSEELGCYRCECEQAEYLTTCFFDFIVGTFILLLGLPLFVLSRMTWECKECGSSLRHRPPKPKAGAPDSPVPNPSPQAPPSQIASA
eukprot:Rmarinus@m.12107